MTLTTDIGQTAIDMGHLKAVIAESERRRAIMEADTMKMSLKPGDQIIALEDARYDTAPEKYSQRKGNIMMVNNPAMYGHVGGCGIYQPNGPEPGEMASRGLGAMMKDGTYRLATPDDPGYMATREEWNDHLRGELRRERLQHAFTILVCTVSVCLNIYLAWR